MKTLVGLFLAASIGVVGWFGFLKEEFEFHMYPVDYSELIQSAAEEHGVPAELVFAVVRTESSFRPDAISKAGAKGLMQIMDVTNEWIAEMRREEVYAERIFEPALNIDRGVWLLAYLYRRFEAWPEALAAYNAGYGNVRKWLADERYSSDGVSLHTIPLSETKTYVEKVINTAEIYKKLYFSDAEK